MARPNKPAAPPPSRIAQLSPYALRRRGGWTLNLFVALLAGAALLLPAWPQQVLIDHVLRGEPQPPWLARLTAALPGATSAAGLLAWAAAAGLAAFALAAVLEVCSAYLLVKVGQRTAYDVARDLFARMQRQSLRFHATHALGDLLSRITGDAWCVYRAVDSVGITTARALVTCAMMAAVLFRMDALLATIAVLAAPVLGVAAWAMRARVRRVARERRDIEGRIQSHVQQTLRGIQVVQAFAREEHEHERFQHFALDVIRAQQRGLMLRQIASLWSGLTRTVGVGLILFFGAQQVLRGDLTAGRLWVFVLYLRSMLVQIETVTAAYITAQEVRAEADRVLEVLASPAAISDGPAGMDRARGAVRISNVTFGYGEGEPVLRGVSVAADPGQTIAIVGPSGAGKSTLMNLIPRFFDPREGVVTIDGTDVRTLRLAELRRQVALVLQEPHLFPMTLAQNIAYGRPDAPRDQIIAAAKAANAHEFIEKLPDGYDTLIGERGATLSGGERQRISIARAILKDAPILILDEPTSALDTQTEAAVMQAIDHLMAGRTTFVIAHRLSTIRRADRIVVLDGGVIVEQGTHDELMQSGGAYRRYYDLQISPTEAGA